MHRRAALHYPRDGLGMSVCFACPGFDADVALGEQMHGPSLASDEHPFEAAAAPCPALPCAAQQQQDAAMF